jgi:glycosyltransferase involved in cell wall biosynthesis
MGEAGRRRVAKVYDWNVKGEQLAKIYQQAIETFNKRRRR